MERVNDRHFWNPGVLLSYAMIPINVAQTESFFSLAASMQVSALKRQFKFVKEHIRFIYLNFEIMHLLFSEASIGTRTQNNEVLYAWASDTYLGRHLGRNPRVSS
jgi:hypothetical protein